MPQVAVAVAVGRADEGLSGVVGVVGEPGDSEGDTSHTSSSSAAPHRPRAASSLVFQYFALLATYHGAVHVPRFWADLLCPVPDTPSAEETETEEVDGGSGSERDDERWADVLLSPVAEIDLSACYVGPTTLLALADLLRVHCVTLPRGRSQRRRPPGKKAADALLTVMAPLWGAGARRASKEEEVVCSLLPQLTTLRLTHLAIDFTAAHGTAGLSGGAAVMRHLLEALQGHPSIQVVDVSGNPVAAALVPTLSRLVQTTPSLRTLVLDGTLLTASEKEMLRAQCLLNELRQQRARGGASGNVDRSSTDSLDSVTRALWVAQMRERVTMAVEHGTAAVPWLLGKSTALVHRYDAAVANASAGERTGVAATRASLGTRDLSEFGTSSVNSLSGMDATPSTEMAYVAYDSASDGAAAASSAAGPPPPGTVWSAECTEVVRCAFMSRAVAQRTVLGGRPVWSNVPEPLDGAAERPCLSAPSAATVAATDLLLSLRQQVLPDPEAPPGLRRHSAPDADFLTTAEENYWTVRRVQDAQWGYVAEKVAQSLVPLSVRHGRTLYASGDECDFIYLLPPSLAETNTYVELHPSGGGGADARRANRVLPGQWVGDAEALDSIPLYAKHLPTTAGASAAALGGHLFTPVAFQRCSTARVVTTAEGEVQVWALPFSVAFFYLYTPYQLLHKQFIHRTPMSAFANVHPVQLSCVPVRLRVSYGTQQTAAAERAHGDTGAPVLCRYNFLSRHVLLLEEGEFLLRLPSLVSHTGHGRSAASVAVVMDDHHLLSGVTVLTQPMLDLDAAARSTATTADGGAADGADDVIASARGPQGTQMLGKDAALRRFRATKAANYDASAAPKPSAAGGTAAEAAAADRDGSDDEDRDSAELRQYRAGGPAARWRYAALTNDEFAALCPALRLILTRHSCVVHSARHE